MAKKTSQETSLIFPDKLEEIMLLQPKTITFGQFAITPMQENILTLVIEKLQQYMTNKEAIWKDQFGLPVIIINCDEAGGFNNKAKVFTMAKDLMKNKLFRYTWVNPRNGRTYDKTGTLFCGVDDEKNTNKIVLTINPWATPYLLYYGLGAGGGYYNKRIALQLRSEYAKRLYKLICTESDRSEYYYSIEDLRNQLRIPDTYATNDIKRRILDVACKQIKESGADVWFEYNLITRHSENKSENSGRKTKADTVVLHIHNSKEFGGKSRKATNSYIHQWLRDAFADQGPDGLRMVQEIEEKLANSPQYDILFNRLTYWESQQNSSKMTSTHIYNSIKKFIREELKYNF